MRAALARLLVKRNVSNAEELLPLEVQNSGMRFFDIYMNVENFCMREQMHLTSRSTCFPALVILLPCCPCRSCRASLRAGEHSENEH